MHLLIIYSVTCSLNDSGQGGGFSGPKKDKQQKGNLPSAGLIIKIRAVPKKTDSENGEIVRVVASIGGVGEPV